MEPQAERRKGKRKGDKEEIEEEGKEEEAEKERRRGRRGKSRRWRKSKRWERRKIRRMKKRRGRRERRKGGKKTVLTGAYLAMKRNSSLKCSDSEAVSISASFSTQQPCQNTDLSRTEDLFMLCVPWSLICKMRVIIIC